MNNAEHSILKSLKFAKSRKHHNMYLIEGKRLIKSALKAHVKIKSIYCSEIFINENKTWIKKNITKTINITIINKKQLQSISNTKSPSGIITYCTMPFKKNLDLNQHKWLYLDKISDPGNLGTLMRSAAWFGILNIALSPNCVDPYNPKTVRSAMGAHFDISINTNITLDNFKHSHKIIYGSLNGKNINNYSFPNKCVLVLGNEAHGISEENQIFIEENISINKIGSGESLNIAAAGAIFLYMLSNTVN